MNNIVFVVVVVLVCGMRVTYASVAEDACAPLRSGGCIEVLCKRYLTWPDVYDSCVADSTQKGPQDSDENIKKILGLCDFHRAWDGSPPINWETECGPLSRCADTIVTGIPKTVLAGDTFNFTIQAVGLNGDNKTTGGDTFTINYDKFLNITDHGDGKYTVFVHVNTECNANSVLTPSLSIQCRGFGPTYQPEIQRCCYGHCVPDPHFTGFSTGTFDYHGRGDFVLCKVQDTLVQVRFTNCNGAGITCPAAIAIRVNGTRYEFYSGSTAKLNGVTATLPAQGQSSTITNSPLSTITRTASTSFDIRAPGLLITVYDYFSYWNSISIHVNIKKGRNEGGLLGRVGKNGEPWGWHPTLAKPFGDSWMISNENDGIFTYTTAVPFDQIYRPNAPQNYNGCGEITPQAREACSILNSTSSLAQQCAGIEDVSVYYNWCVTDTVCTGQALSVDTLVNTVSTKCQRKANVIIALPTSAVRSKASGPGLASTVTRLTAVQFNITSYDALGRRITTGGNPFQVVAAPALTILRRDNNDGTYTHSYSPIIARTYAINITKSGAHIDGSPFTVNVV